MVMKKTPKKQTTEQKVTRREYQIKSKAMDKAKQSGSSKAFVAGFKAVKGEITPTETKKQIGKAKNKSTKIFDLLSEKKRKRALVDKSVSYGVGAARQEKTAIARAASKRKAITGKASDYQQSRGKKK